MPKAVAGSYYTVVRGDRIRRIAREAYGYDRSSDVVQANAELLKGKPISLEGLPTIYHGNRLWLSAVKKQFSEKIDASTDDEIAIKIEGQIFRGWTASNIRRNINTVADAFSFNFPYDPTDKTLVELTRPYSYKSAELFIGGELYIAAEQNKWSTSSSTDETIKTVDCRTIAGKTVECMAEHQSLEYTDQTLSQIAKAIMKPYGDDLEPLFFDGDSDNFTKVRKEITDTDFDFLSGLAAQKGFMITSSDTGQMAFIRAALTGRPVFRFIEGVSAVEHISTVYDGQSVFSSITAVTESAGKPGPSSNISNKLVPIYRPLIFEASDLEEGNLDTAIKWKRSKALADSTVLVITVTGWRNETGQLWRENMKGTALWPSVDILTESDYIISGVQLVKDQNGGNVSKLTMVIPQAYSLEYPSSFPWGVN
jgi:prophage tail gpP-like protein